MMTKNQHVKNKFLIGGAVGLVILIAAVLLYFNNAGKAGELEKTAIDPAFSAYISSYTAGVISAQSPVRIRLAMDVVDSAQFGEKTDLFGFDPAVKGKAIWLDVRTVDFYPDEKLRSGQTYGVKFYLSKILEVPDDLNVFDYQFQVIKQNFDVKIENIETIEQSSLKAQRIVGVLSTADVADDKAVEKIIAATQEGIALPVAWQHSSDGHRFIIEDVERKPEKSRVSLMLNGDPLRIDKKEQQEVVIPVTTTAG